jgi:hypothetical protein
MRIFARLGPLLTLVALSANLGCSKEKEVATTPEVTSPEQATNVAGMAKETLLALKFHHDS